MDKEVSYLNFSGDLGFYIKNKKSREKLVNTVLRFKPDTLYEKQSTKRFQSSRGALYIKNIDNDYFNNLINWNFLKKITKGNQNLYMRNPVITDLILDKILNVELNSVYQEKTFTFEEIEFHTYGDTKSNNYKNMGQVNINYSSFYTFILFNGLPFLDRYKIKYCSNSYIIGFDLILKLPYSIFAIKNSK